MWADAKKTGLTEPQPRYAKSAVAAVFGALAVLFLLCAPVHDAAAQQVRKHPGASVYKSAGCITCHKWHGMGGPGYGGTPINFRETILDKQQLMEVVACGRPGTGMPSHHKSAYKGYDCYGLTKEDLGEDLPGRSRYTLSMRQINNVSDFIVEHFKGRTNDLVRSDCTIFFGDSRMCRNLDMAGGAGGGH
jgi:hypothetical protein